MQSADTDSRICANADKSYRHEEVVNSIASSKEHSLDPGSDHNIFHTVPSPGHGHRGDSSQ